MKKKEIKVYDILHFKYVKDCDDSSYYYGGTCKGGMTCIVESIGDSINSQHIINVKSNNHIYKMMESDFILNSDMFPIF